MRILRLKDFLVLRFPHFVKHLNLHFTRIHHLKVFLGFIQGFPHVIFEYKHANQQTSRCNVLHSSNKLLFWNHNNPHVLHNLTTQVTVHKINKLKVGKSPNGNLKEIKQNTRHNFYTFYFCVLYSHVILFHYF